MNKDEDNGSSGDEDSNNEVKELVQGHYTLVYN
jgi:hypothetical protein